MRTGNGKKLVRAALLALMLFMFLFVYKAETARAEEQPAAGFSVQSPRITGESRSAVSANGRTVSFRVTAAGTGLSYRWQYSVDNGRTWHDSSMSGCTTSTIKIPAAAKRNGYLYRCIVKNSYGSVTSSPAKLTVSGVKPAVRSQTKAVTSAPKVKAAFRVEAAGIGLSYQWQYSRDGGKTWHDSTMTGCLLRGTEKLCEGCPEVGPRQERALSGCSLTRLIYHGMQTDPHERRRVLP